MSFPNFPQRVSRIHRVANTGQLHSYHRSTNIGVIDGRLKFHNGSTVATLLDDQNDDSTSGLDTINVLNYGAIGDGDSGAADTAGIQAAIDAAGGVRRRIVIPSTSDRYVITEPIMIVGQHPPFIEGEQQGSGDHNQTGVILATEGYIGPLFYARDAQTPVAMPYTTSLATGAGSALHFSQNVSNDVHLDLVDAGPSCLFDGYEQFSVECFIKIVSTNTDFQAKILESRGGIINGTNTSAFGLRVDIDGHLIGYINVGGVSTTITSAATLTLNQTYQVELSFDGTTVRLFYGIPGNTSVLAGTQALAGTVQHTLFETLRIGGVCQNWPTAELTSGPPEGYIDSIRISFVARHTATYTAPSAKFTADGATLLLQNFDNETDYFSIIYTDNGPAYLPKRGGTHGQASGFSLRNVMLESAGSALRLVGMIQTDVQDCGFYGGIYGIDADGDTFLNRYMRLTFSGNAPQSRVGFANRSQAGICTWQDLDFGAWPVGFYCSSGGGVISSNYYHGGQAVTHMVLRGPGSWTLHSVAFSNEDASPANFVSDMYLDGVDSVVLNDVGIEAFASASVIAIQVRGGHSIILNGGDVYPHASATKVIDVLSAPDQPIMVNNTWKRDASVPWATSGWVRVTPSENDTRPIRASGFGTSSAFSGGWSAFTLNVGTGGTASNGVITLPPAVHGWMATINNLTARLANRTDTTVQIAGSTTSITIENQDNTGAAAAWGASDILHITCVPY